MKKLLIALLIAIMAAPAMAGVIVDANATDLEVTVSYDTNGLGKDIRAFGLDVTVDNGAKITAVTDLSLKSGNGYWVHPGSIVISGSSVTNEGTPVSPNSYPDTLGGLNTAGITIEMGSLYEGANTPSTTGSLLSFTVDLNGADDCNVVVALNSTRGGVVIDDLTAADAVLEGCKVTGGWYPPCWDYDTQCNGDTDNNVTVDIIDWPVFRDGFGLSLAGNGQAYVDQACADFNRDGAINISDWPIFRDNFGGTPAGGCTQGDFNNVFEFWTP